MILKASKSFGMWWACGDLNARPLPCQGRLSQSHTDTPTENTGLTRFQVGSSGLQFPRFGMDREAKSPTVLTYEALGLLAGGAR